MIDYRYEFSMEYDILKINKDISKVKMIFWFLRYIFKEGVQPKI